MTKWLLRRLRKSLNARPREHVKRKLVTLKKHHALPKTVRESFYSNKELRRSKIVVLQLCRVVVLLMSSPRHLQQQLTAAAAEYFSHASFGSKFCRIGQ